MVRLQTFQRNFPTTAASARQNGSFAHTRKLDSGQWHEAIWWLPVTFNGDGRRMAITSNTFGKGNAFSSILFQNQGDATHECEKTHGDFPGHI